jgi:hypothetical protein
VTGLPFHSSEAHNYTPLTGVSTEKTQFLKLEQFTNEISELLGKDLPANPCRETGAGAPLTERGNKVLVFSIDIEIFF